MIGVESFVLRSIKAVVFNEHRLTKSDLFLGQKIWAPGDRENIMEALLYTEIILKWTQSRRNIDSVLQNCKIKENYFALKVKGNFSRSQDRRDEEKLSVSY